MSKRKRECVCCVCVYVVELVVELVEAIVLSCQNYYNKERERERKKRYNFSYMKKGFSLLLVLLVNKIKK